MMKMKDVSHRVEVDATPPFSVSSLSVGISSDVTPGGDHVAVLDTELVEHVDLIASKGTKLTP